MITKQQFKELSQAKPMSCWLTPPLFFDLSFKEPLDKVVFDDVTIPLHLVCTSFSGEQLSCFVSVSPSLAINRVLISDYSFYKL